MENKKRFNFRAFVSIMLFVLLIMLFITAIGIEILDHIIEDQPKLLSRVTRVHVISGYIFVVLSFFHIVKNWKVLKSYFKKK